VRKANPAEVPTSVVFREGTLDPEERNQEPRYPERKIFRLCLGGGGKKETSGRAKGSSILDREYPGKGLARKEMQKTTKKKKKGNWSIA